MAGFFLRRDTMDSLALVGLILGFYVTIVAVVAIVHDKDDIAQLATKVLGQVAKILSKNP
jgi:hypothetical protein